MASRALRPTDITSMHFKTSRSLQDWPLTKLTLQKLMGHGSIKQTERYLAIKAKCACGEVELVDAVRADMLRLRKRFTPAGISVQLPHSADGRHCDFAPVVMLGLGRWLKDEIIPSTQTPEAKEAARLLKDSLRRYGRPKK